MALTTAELQILITAKDLASQVLDSTADKQDKTLKRLEQGSMVATAAIAALGIGAISMAANFEQGLDQVGAVAQASEAQMKSLREEALKIGADTAFSSSQAVAAMEELAAGGRSVGQILGGEALAAVNLAAAGNYDLAESGRVIATVMDLWKDTQLSTNDVVNRLAGAANASRFGVEDMAQSLSQAGGVAAQMGVTWEEMTTAVAATASSFASGSDAGTSYKTMLLQLDGTTDKAKDVIAQYGLEFRNANGSIKSTAEIADELATKIGVLGEAQQVAALKTIFGNDAYRSAAALMDLTAEGVNKVDAALSNTDAAEVAAQRMSNAKGSIEELKGSAETLAISLGSYAIPALTAGAEGATMLVNAFGAMPGSTQAMVLGVGAFAAAMPAAVSAVRSVATAVRDFDMVAGSLQGKLALFTAGVGATLIATDLILQKTSGHGLGERIFGDVSKADAAAEAMTKMANNLAYVVDPAEKTATAIQLMNAQLESFAANGGAAMGEVSAFGQVVGGADGRLFGFNVGLSAGKDRLNEYEAAVAAAASVMVQNNASAQDLYTTYLQLPAELRHVWQETTQVTEKMDAAWRATQQYDSELVRAAMSAGPAAEANAAYGASSQEAAKSVEELAETIKNLNKGFNESNPAYIELNASLALVNEAIGDLEAKGKNLTASEQAHLASLKSQKEGLEQQIGAMDSNREAMDGLQGSLERLMGPQGYAGLLEAMAAAQTPAEQQIENIANVRLAYQQLATGAIPGAIESLGKLKETMSPEEWAALAKAVGPKVIEEISKAASGPERDKMIEDWNKLGGDIAAGVTAGVRSAAQSVVDAVNGMVRNALASGRAEAGAESPAKKWIPLGRDMIDGLIVGVEERSTALREATAMAVAAAQASGAAAATTTVTIIAGVPVVGPPTSPAAPVPSTPKQPPIVSGVPVVGPPKAGNSSLDPKLVPVGNGVFWNTETGQFETHLTDLGGGAMWNGTDLVTAPGGYQNKEKVYTDGKGNWYWTLDDSLAWSAATGATSTAAFNAVHGQNDILEPARRAAQGLPPMPFPLNNDNFTVANREAGEKAYREQAIKTAEAAAKARGAGSHDASPYGYLDGERPPQWMIDSRDPVTGAPMWAKYGWAFDPWTGFTKLKPGQSNGGFGGLGGMMGQPGLGSAGFYARWGQMDNYWAGMDQKANYRQTSVNPRDSMAVQVNSVLQINGETIGKAVARSNRRIGGDDA